MKHPHAELIKAWADDTSIRFECKSLGVRGGLACITEHPEYEWQIYKEPVVEVEYYVKHGDGDFIRVHTREYVANWNMRITITDGDRKNAKVELR